ncbi:GTP pyrophosphokinase [Schleiferilactobacillus shenzhenensis]|nr:GTP pyrophosphokinase [Schleiferilactobacillus shenzhenensis]
MILERNNFFSLKQIETEARQFGLQDQFADFSRLLHLYELRQAGANEIGTKLENLDDDYAMTYDYNPIHHIEERTKSIHSLVEKMRRKDYEFSIENVEDHIFDIAGIRVVTNYIDDVYEIERSLVSQTDVTLVERKDYIAQPKPSGYRSLHIVVSVPVFQARGTYQVPVEVQIRSVGMDMWASLEHRLRYKTDMDPAEVEKHAQALVADAEELNQIELRMQGISKQLRETKGKNRSVR